MNVTDKITDHFRLVGKQLKALNTLGLVTIEDLLLHIPQRYEDIGNAMNIADVQNNAGSGEMITVYGELADLKKTLMWKTKKYAIDAKLRDDSGSITLRWFNQTYIFDKLQFVTHAKVTGKLTGSGSRRYFANPTIEPLPGLVEVRDSESGLFPVYKTSYGITSKWFFYAIKRVLNELNEADINDPIPAEILSKYNLPDLYKAIIYAHNPVNVEQTQVATKRFAFQEIFYIQLFLASLRQQRKLKRARALSIKRDNINGDIKDFIAGFGFELTGAQKHVIKDILQDMSKQYPMGRLLEGDVGSGKTAVAATIAFVTVNNKDTSGRRMQVAYMAPTEVLAKQLFEDFIKYFKGTNINLGLLTGKKCMKFPSKSNPNEPTRISKAQLLKWIQDNTLQIVIGTHALLQDKVVFNNMALAIIDEQHRFGTKQRANLTKLASNSETMPHLLSMSATPIPRTLALTMYGDLELSVIDEMPKGRKKVITKIVKLKEKQEVYEQIRKAISGGKQAYVICPKVRPSDLSDNDGKPPSAQKIMMAKLKNVEEEREVIEKVYPEFVVDTIHGKLKTQEKEEIMQKFKNNEIQILVATSVIEVGVNVPNATIILIEGAERFGLAQLHQLRGRVLRSSYQAYCYLSTTSSTLSETTEARLTALVKSSDGFELAEQDLLLRGAGELRGDSQWGESDIAMTALKNIKMVEAARKEAFSIIDKGIINKYPQLIKEVESVKDIHFE